jgi:hypothetical protein
MAENTALGANLIAVELGNPNPADANNVVDAFAKGGGGNGNPVGNWVWTDHPLQHWELWTGQPPRW